MSTGIGGNTEIDGTEPHLPSLEGFKVLWKNLRHTTKRTVVFQTAGYVRSWLKGPGTELVT